MNLLREDPRISVLVIEAGKDVKDDLSATDPGM